MFRALITDKPDLCQARRSVRQNGLTLMTISILLWGVLPASSDPTANPVETAPIEAAQPSGEPEVDDRIKVRVTPVVLGPVVDRVTEATSVSVNAPAGASSVELYLEPVDAPYGGRSKGEARLLGKASSYQAVKRFTVAWNSAEPHRYVRLYALAYDSTGHPSKSRGLDLGMGGARLLPEIEPPATKPPQKPEP